MTRSPEDPLFGERDDVEDDVISGPSELQDTQLSYTDKHVFSGSRCVYCNVNDLDASLYGPEVCPVTEDRQERWMFPMIGPRMDPRPELTTEWFGGFL